MLLHWYKSLIIRFSSLNFIKNIPNLDWNINIFIFINIASKIHAKAEYNKKKLKTKIHNSNVTKKLNYVIRNHEAGSDTFHWKVALNFGKMLFIVFLFLAPLKKPFHIV